MIRNALERAVARRWRALPTLAAVLALTSGAFGPSIAAAAADCTGSVVGRLMLADGTPAANEWVQVTGMPGDPDGQGKLTRVAADGGFRVDGVPPGRHNGAARHAMFAFVLGGCGQVVDLGDVEYPIFHPNPSPVPVGRADPAARALERFMDARIGRRDLDVLAMLADDFRSGPPGSRGELAQVSNPCWYRYDVVSLLRWTAPGAGQPPPGSVEALVRTYAHVWSGDNGGLPPFSFAQTVRLVETPAGWRVARLQLIEYRDELGEPHGPTTSACNVGRRPAVWPAYALPGSGGPPAWPGVVLGAVIISIGRRLRSRGEVSWRG